MIKSSDRKLSWLGFDTRPLDRKSIVVETECRTEGNIRVIQVELVHRVATWFFAGGIRSVLPRPPIVVPVAPFDLMRSRCGTPSKTLWKVRSHARTLPFLTPSMATKTSQTGDPNAADVKD
jgi:hypothetical protein